MSQPPPIPTLEYDSPVPPPSQCAFCHRPLTRTFYRIQSKPACEPCTHRLSQLIELNNFRFAPWLLGLVYGLAAALLCGFAWAVITKITHFEIGIAAVAVGYLVTRSIIAGANGRRGTSIQIIAVILSLAGVFIGKGLTAILILSDRMTQDPAMQNHPMLFRTILFFTAPIVGFQMFDLIWYAIAAYQAWRMSQPLRLNIEGPFGAAPASPFSPQPQAFTPPPPLQQPAPPRSTPLPKAILITLISAAFSALIYSQEDGWPFAAGFVLCILIHELGHTISCLMYGLPASSPIFIPYVGALISLRANPPDAKVEAVIGIAGPIGGLLAGSACYIWFIATHSQLAANLVAVSAFMNLFNMIPIHPLDGGRIARGVAPGFWPVFLLPLAAFCAFAEKLGMRIEVAGLVTVITLIGVGRTLKQRKGSYYDISPAAAWTMGLAYLSVAATLLWMWTQVRGVQNLW
jgi:Zn-dependent protease